MKSSTTHPTDITFRWQQASLKFQRMSAEEQGEIMVSAGILTKKGNVTKRYKGVIVPVVPNASRRTK